MRQGKRDQRKEVGIPNLAQIERSEEGFRPLSAQASETPFAGRTALRSFVSENGRMREDADVKRKIPLLSYRDSQIMNKLFYCLV